MSVVSFNRRTASASARRLELLGNLVLRRTNAAWRQQSSCARFHPVWYSRDMETDLKIDVATLDAPHRRALEEVIGRELATSQRLIISVIDVAVPAGST